MSVLNHKAALVTGAGRGIGRGLALELAKQGAAVALASDNQDELDEVAAEIVKSGGRAKAFVVELRDSKMIGEMVAKAEGWFGGIDILVNNAAIPGPIGVFARIDIDEWMDTQAVNVLAPVRLGRLVLPRMIAQGWGRILNISSGVARARVGEVLNAYGVAKAALETHSTKLALELEGSGVTINVLRPATTDTPMQAQLRALDPAKVGVSVESFKTNWRMGLIAPVEVPVARAMEILGGDGNGLIIEMRRQRGPSGSPEDSVESLAVIG